MVVECLDAGFDNAVFESILRYRGMGIPIICLFFVHTIKVEFSRAV